MFYKLNKMKFESLNLIKIIDTPLYRENKSE